MTAIALWAVALFVIPVIISYGITFSYLQSIAGPDLAKQDYRSDMGSAVLMGIIAAMLSWFGVFVVLCLTGFAQHGVKFR